MTISNTSSQITVAGDGLTSTFNYNFPMPSASFAVLIYTNTASITSSISSSLFSMTGVGPTSSGGTFTYPLVGSPISTSTTLTLKRIVPLVQNASVYNQGNFYPATVEGALDYAMMAIQQLQQEVADLQVAVAADNP